MGVQLRTTFWGGHTRTRFIPASQIAGVVINEGITMLQVKFYLALVVDGESSMVVAFPSTLPRLHILERVYVHLRETLVQL
nr:hypothetical protein HK105_006139 [Polyrhizophydium stewartii]